MYSTIKNFCESDEKSGLFLLDAPTGFGKSYSVYSYIKDVVAVQKHTRKRIFFITSLLKNLDFNKLREIFESEGFLDDFEKKFLKIESNVDCIKNNFTEDLKEKIPDFIKNLPEYKALEQTHLFLKNFDLSNPSSNSIKNYRKKVEEEFGEKIEPAFRKRVQIIFSTQNKGLSTKEKLFVIKTSNDWKWLGELYPSVYTKEKQIIFLSVDKFLSKNTTFIEPAYTLYMSEIVKNSFVFIDEFDATKETILNNIIKNDLTNPYDCINMFNQINSALSKNEFPLQLMTYSKKGASGKYKDIPLSNIIDNIKRLADEIYKKYNLSMALKVKNIDDLTGQYFLFQDYKAHNIFNGRYEHINLVSDFKKKQNFIVIEDGKKGKVTVSEVLNSLRGFISYFSYGVSVLAANYLEKKEEQKEPIEYENAIKTVLHFFNLNDEYKDFLSANIILSSFKSKQQLYSKKFDSSFYENGFRYYSIADDVRHDLHSEIFSFNFIKTPEKILLYLCKRTKVIGISATATLPVAHSNYDLNFLRENLNGTFKTISQEEYIRIKGDFLSSIKGYENINIHTHFIPSSFEISNTFHQENIIDEPEICFALSNFIKQNSLSEYIVKRYIRISQIIYLFIKKDIQSFLCLLNTFPDRNNTELNEQILENIFNIISDYLKSPYTYKSSVVILKSENYDFTKKDVISKLSSGEHLFVFTTYKTVGAGQNLQYSIPDGYKNDIVSISGRKSLEKDFDAIYLDLPTHLFVLLNDAPEEPESKMKDLIKSIFEAKYLCENGEFSISQTNAHIKNVFKRLSGEYVPNTKFSDTNSAIMLTTRIIIQAIGRMCRTNNKRKDIYVLADEQLINRLWTGVLDNRLLNPEAEKLFIAARERQQSLVCCKDDFINKALLVSDKTNTKINALIGKIWDTNAVTDSDIWEYRTMREMSAKKPNVSAEEVDWFYKNTYVELPNEQQKYYYTQNDDYRNVKISFELNDKDVFQQEVSSQDAGLDDLMAIPDLKKYFEQNGIATEWTSSKYLPSPPLFNIYKGYIGEMAGKWVFEKILNIPLDEIEDIKKFERFDFKVKEMPIYVDFKNWGGRYGEDRKTILEKINEKAVYCGDCECVLIVNIRSNGLSNQFDWRDKIFKKVRIIEVASLIGNGILCQENCEKIRRIINEYTD